MVVGAAGVADLTVAAVGLAAGVEFVAGGEGDGGGAVAAVDGDIPGDVSAVFKGADVGGGAVILVGAAIVEAGDEATSVDVWAAQLQA